MSRLDEALDEFIAKNKREVDELRHLQMKENIMQIWKTMKAIILMVIEKIGEGMVNLWKVFDEGMEMLDSIPDILQEFALRIGR